MSTKWRDLLFLAGLLLCLVLCSRVCGLVRADATDTKEIPFRISISTHIGSAPMKLKVEARFDAERVIGALCLIVDSDADYHSSCWEQQGLGAPFRSVIVVLGKPGEYSLQLQQVSGNGKRLSNVETVLLQ